MSLQYCFPIIPIIIGLVILTNLARNLAQKRRESLPGSVFIGAEQAYQRLKKTFNNKTGVLTEHQRRLLQDIMVQDEQGRWWTIGYETGQWYFHDGEKWVPSIPLTTDYSSSTPGQNAVQQKIPTLKMWLSGMAGLTLLGLGLVWLAANLGLI